MSSEKILGVAFFTGSIEDAVGKALEGGTVNAPSGPGLAVDLLQSEAYRQALLAADMNITDSGIMVLLWRLCTGRRIPRHSGLKFLRALLERAELRQPGAVFWIMPTDDEDRRNRLWLNEQGFTVTADDVYIAPRYGPGKLRDEVLLSRIEKRRPRVVMMAIGGGVQERLGGALKEQLSYRPGILCLGAAIAFLSGGQANIPPWADYLMLGWLYRIVFSPRRYFPRYWAALRIVHLIWRYRDKLPPFEK
jgi:UDP-N-acetyl-D-mannosaminuronic acid transferase (WecB/TagA/CpsF family)